MNFSWLFLNSTQPFHLLLAVSSPHSSLPVKFICHERHPASYRFRKSLMRLQSLNKEKIIIVKSCQRQMTAIQSTLSEPQAHIYTRKKLPGTRWQTFLFFSFFSQSLRFDSNTYPIDEMINPRL
jgi:hypothetical protein